MILFSYLMFVATQNILKTNDKLFKLDNLSEQNNILNNFILP